jgi:hypothetical protein
VHTNYFVYATEQPAAFIRVSFRPRSMATLVFSPTRRAAYVMTCSSRREIDNYTHAVSIPILSSSFYMTKGSGDETAHFLDVSRALPQGD